MIREFSYYKSFFVTRVRHFKEILSLNSMSMLLNKIFAANSLRHLQRSFKKGEVLSVYFAITTPNLYEIPKIFEHLERSPLFQLKILLFPNSYDTLGLAEYERNLEKLSQDNSIVIGALNSQKKIIPKRHLLSRKSIIFWGETDLRIHHRSWDIRRVARRHLLFYIPYNVKVIDLKRDHYQRPVHHLAYKIFAETPWHQEQFRKFGRLKGKNVVWIGCSKLEGLLEPPQNECSVLLAPHWTLQNRKIGIGAFQNYYKELLKLPSEFQTIHFVLRPHPSWYRAVIESGLMPKKTLDAYIQHFDSYPNASYESEYSINAVRSVSAIITDSGSFLAEFLYTLQPILLLHAKFNFNEFGMKIAGSQYRLQEFDSISAFIRKVVIDKSDIKATMRKQVKIKNIGLFEGNLFSINLLNYMVQTLDKRLHRF